MGGAAVSRRQVGRVRMGAQLSKLLEWLQGRGVHPSFSEEFSL